MHIKSTKNKCIKGTQTLNVLKKEDGLTLLDLAIILLVAGFITAPLLSEYRNWSKRANTLTTTDKIFSVEEAIKQYYYTNKHYPCPANPTIGPDTIVPAGQPGYGEENRAAPVAPAIVGDCIQVGAPQIVVYGAVPFRTLNMTEGGGLDAWRRKLSYAVTVTKTHPDTYSASTGVISITKPQSLQATANGEDTCQANLANPNVTNIDLVLLSHGRTGAGAYNKDGALISACPATVDTDGDGYNDGDGENCNNDPIFRFPECSANDSNTTAGYDDLMYASYGDGTSNDGAGEWNSTPKKLWEEGSTAENTKSDIGYIGIGHGDPQHALDVMGNIKATNLDGATDDTDEHKGNTLASTYCDSNGENCFNSNSIAGDDTAMACRGTNTGVTGFGSNKAKCTVLPFDTTTCPVFEFIIGITETGVVKCGK